LISLSLWWYKKVPVCAFHEKLFLSKRIIGWVAVERMLPQDIRESLNDFTHCNLKTGCLCTEVEKDTRTPS